MPGRPAKPTALHVIEGTLHATRHRARAAAPEATGQPEKPKFLKGRASRLWDETAPLLVAMGVAKQLDAHVLAAWCCLMAEFEKDPKAMTASRISQMRALAGTLGMTPSDRARMGASNGAGKQATSAAAKFFGEGKAG